MTAARARRVHQVVAAVAWTAVVFQLVLVVSGEAILVEEDPPGLVARTYRYFAYFTIQSNVLVALSSTVLARDPREDQVGWRAVRLAGLVGITVTALVYFVLLRGLVELDGANWLADALLHMVVPSLTVVAWVAVGPRPRIGPREVAYALAWPVLWLAWTLAVGQVDGWVPYPFLDADDEGWGAVGIACTGITILFLGLFALYAWLDRRLRPTPR